MNLLGLRSEGHGPLAPIYWNPSGMRSWPGPRGMGAGQPRRAGGFSLLELIVAMAIFLIVSSASFTLFSRHETLLSQTQGVAGLNIGMRNALSQLQMDIVNAGSGMVIGANVPAWPVGISIYNSNASGTACTPTISTNQSRTPPQYQSQCFDSLTVVMVDPNTPAVHPLTSTGGGVNTCGSTTPPCTATVTVYGQPTTGYTSAGIYANFQAGDQVLFVQANPTGVEYLYTTAVLTAAGSNYTTAGPVVNTVKLTFTATLGPSVNYPNGGNNSTGSNPPYGPNDPIGITTNAPANELSSTFASEDWLVRLVPITYAVNVTNNADDPELVRSQLAGSAGSQTMVNNTVMDQVIGFKVGAARRQNLVTYTVNTSGTSVNMANATNFANGLLAGQVVTINNIDGSNGDFTIASPPVNANHFTLTSDAGEQSGVTLTGPISQIYPYDYSTSDYNSDFANVQAVRVTLIGRTTPSNDPLYTYENPFDQGFYQIRGSSIIVNPRNLTMRNY